MKEFALRPRSALIPRRSFGLPFPVLLLVMVGAISPSLFAQETSSPLPIAQGQASPYAPGSIVFSITAPPSISIETPAAASGGRERAAAHAAGAGQAAGDAAAGAGAGEAASRASGARAGEAASRAPSAAGDNEMVGYASWYGPKFQGRLTADGETYNMYDLTAAHRTLPFGTLVRVTDLITGKSVVVRINDRGPFVAGRIIDLSKSAAEIIGMPGIARVRLQVVGRATAAEFAPMQNSELAAAHLGTSREGGTAIAAVAGEPSAVGRQGPNGNEVAVSISDLSGGDRPGAGQSGTPRLVPVEMLKTQGGEVGSAAAHGVPHPRGFVVQVGAFEYSTNAAKLQQLLISNGFAPRLERSGRFTRVVIPHVSAIQVASTESRLAALGIHRIVVRGE